MPGDSLWEKYRKFKADINSASLMAELDAKDYPERSVRYICYKHDAERISKLSFILQKQINDQNVYDELISLTELLVKELRVDIPYYKDARNVPEPLRIWDWHGPPPDDKEAVSWEPCQDKDCKNCLEKYRKRFSAGHQMVSLKYCSEKQD